jgi:hypothetical protein
MRVTSVPQTWIEIAVVSLVLRTRWMSPGGAKPLTSLTWFSLRPTCHVRA